MRAAWETVTERERERERESDRERDGASWGYSVANLSID